MSVRWIRAAGGLGAFCGAQRPTGVRCKDDRNRNPCLTERAWPARLVEGSADFKETRVVLIAAPRCFRPAPLQSTATLLLADKASAEPSRLFSTIPPRAVECVLKR
jgi:hypothetical protein